MSGSPSRDPSNASEQGAHSLDNADSVSLDALQATEGESPTKSEAKDRGRPRLGVSGLKIIVALFLLFVVVVSDAFTNTVISAFGQKAVRGRSPTAWGVVLQGIFLVIGYVLLLYLIDRGIF
jgi:hypothetical protein